MFHGCNYSSGLALGLLLELLSNPRIFWKPTGSWLLQNISSCPPLLPSCLRRRLQRLLPHSTLYCKLLLHANTRGKMKSSKLVHPNSCDHLSPFVRPLLIFFSVASSLYSFFTSTSTIVVYLQM